MPLNKSKGNMYSWVGFTHSHMGGECPHRCIYCYTAAMAERFPAMQARYAGPLRLIEDEFKVNYGEGKTIFIEHQNDLFATDVPADFIRRIMTHCRSFPCNTYVLQTKNPARYFMNETLFPYDCILGTTIETNRETLGISGAPCPKERMLAMEKLHGRKFVTIEPVLDFDVDILADWIRRINPEFLNLGADSKSRNLLEPTVAKIMALVAKLHEYGIELREKHNLQRLKPN